MIYLFTFLLCLVVDKMKIKHKNIYFLVVIWLYAFLCFGYMTGSDWREYELMYNNQDFERILYKGEYGFAYLMKLFNLFIDDFWIFSAIVKIFFLCNLIKFFGFFSESKIYALGLSFCFNTLFLIIDCPMRFMIGVSFMLIAIRFLIFQKFRYYLLLFLVAALMHNSLLLIGIIPIIIYFLSPLIAEKIHDKFLWLFFIFCLLISNHPIIRETIYGIGESIPMLEHYLYWYGEDRVTDFSILSLLKTGVIGSFLILNGGKIKTCKNGSFVFSMVFFSLTIGLFLELIPTGFRLNIIPKFFQVIALASLLSAIKYKEILSFRILLKCSLISLFFILLMKDMQSPKYTPYSNSIYYIVTGHLPYSYRYTHNYRPEK